MKAYDYLIVGGGIAGTTAAEVLREKGGRHVTVAILETEPYPLYSKVLIPDYLKNRIPREKLFLRKITDYEKKGIDLFLSTKVKGLSAARKEIFAEDGRIFPYKKLLIASGGKPKELPDSLAAAASGILPKEYEETPEILRMHTLDDADKVKEAVKKPGVSLTLGEGFIALEFLETFYVNNFETHAASRGNYFFEEKFGQDGAEILEKQLEKNRVKLHKRSGIYFVKGKEVSLTNNEKITADAVGVGIGLERNFGVFSDGGGGIKVNKGIITNKFLETSDENIFAAGDAAEFYDSVAGRSRIVGNWTNSFLQGRCAALNMLGERRPYETVTTYNITTFGINLTFMGDIADGEEFVEKTNSAGDAFLRVVLRSGVIKGAVLINRFTDTKKLLELIRGKKGKDELKQIF